MPSCQVAVAKLGEVLGKTLNCRGAKEILLVLETWILLRMRGMKMLVHLCLII